MATTKPSTKRAPQRMSLRDELAHDYCMSVLKSTATFEMLDQKDGVWTARLIKLGNEYADKKLAVMGGAA